MAVNPAQYPSGEPFPLTSGAGSAPEVFIVGPSRIFFEVQSGAPGDYPGSSANFEGQGRVFLSPHRIVFACSAPDALFRGFELPVAQLAHHRLREPILWGSAVVEGIIKPTPGGGLMGDGAFRLRFDGGGAQQFYAVLGTCLRGDPRAPPGAAFFPPTSFPAGGLPQGTDLTRPRVAQAAIVMQPGGDIACGVVMRAWAVDSPVDLVKRRT